MGRESGVTRDMVWQVLDRLIERRPQWLADPIMVFRIAFIWTNLILNADWFLLEQHIPDGLGETIVKNTFCYPKLKQLSKKVGISWRNIAPLKQRAHFNILEWIIKVIGWSIVTFERLLPICAYLPVPSTITETLNSAAQIDKPIISFYTCGGFQGVESKPFWIQYV